MILFRSIVLTLTSACFLACGGAAPESGSGPNTLPPSEGKLLPEHYTPGYFRDVAGVLQAQEAVDDGTASRRLMVEVSSRLQDLGDLPDLYPEDQAVLQGLLMLALRSIQATSSTPRTARIIGEELLRRTLGQDPALLAYNSSGANFPITTADPATLAEASRWALNEAAGGVPALCSRSIAQAASLNLGEAVKRWRDEECIPARTVGGYCEPDRFIEGRCYDEWVPERCDGGYWDDQGFYEYRCFSSDDCRYVWRDRFVYVDGHCTDGFYRERCENGYWEIGLCYDGTFIPERCRPGHFEFIFPGAIWVFAATAAPSSDCEPARPVQLAIATAAIRMLKAQAYDEIDPVWRSAIELLLEDPAIEEEDEGILSAAQQIIESIASGYNPGAEPGPSPSESTEN